MLLLSARRRAPPLPRRRSWRSATGARRTTWSSWRGSSPSATRCCGRSGARRRARGASASGTSSWPRSGRGSWRARLRAGARAGGADPRPPRRRCARRPSAVRSVRARLSRHPEGCVAGAGAADAADPEAMSWPALSAPDRRRAPEGDLERRQPGRAAARRPAGGARRARRGHARQPRPAAHHHPGPEAGRDATCWGRGRARARSSCSTTSSASSTPTARSGRWTCCSSRGQVLVTTADLGSLPGGRRRRARSGRSR